MRWLANTSVVCYYRLAYRIQGWGGLPSTPGPKLLVANHQHEIESAVIVASLSFSSHAWRYPIFTVSSRRMWEPGFMAERLPWLSPLLRGINLGKLFGSLGMQPLENELSARPFSSIAFTLSQQHGNLAVDAVFSRSALDRLPRSVQSLRDVLAPKHFRTARSYVKLAEIVESYRKELLDLTRAQIEGDLAHFEALQRSGATIFLTPEGFYSGDGKMQRLRGSLPRLAPLAEIWLAGISYDPFVGRRLSMLYHVERAAPQVALDLQLKRVRPVTASALLGAWLHSHADASFTEDEARRAVASALAELPRALFVDPALRREPSAMVTRALNGMARLDVARKEDGVYRLSPTRIHPQFPRTRDIVEYLHNFHQETLDGGREAR